MTTEEDSQVRADPVPHTYRRAPEGHDPGHGRGFERVLLFTALNACGVAFAMEHGRPTEHAERDAVAPMHHPKRVHVHAALAICRFRGLAEHSRAV